MEFDFRGLKCPQPVLKLTIQMRKIPAGTLIEILADCVQFPDDVKKWCEKQGKVLVSCTNVGSGVHKALVQF